MSSNASQKGEDEVGGVVWVRWRMEVKLQLNGFKKYVWENGKVIACLMVGRGLWLLLYGGKCSRTWSKNYGGISLFSLVVKIYYRIWIYHVERINKPLVGEQSGFIKGKVCVNQVFALWLVVEKVVEKKK